MMTKLMTAALAVLLLPMALACSPVSGDTPAKEASIEVSIDEFEQAKNVTRDVVVAEGGTLTLTLGSNPTTGFSWPEDAEVADPAVLLQTGSEMQPAQAQGMVGAPGAQVWTFKALKKGATTVSLDYSRPWEGGEKGVWTFELTVAVK